MQVDPRVLLQQALCDLTERLPQAGAIGKPSLEPDFRPASARTLPVLDTLPDMLQRTCAATAPACAALLAAAPVLQWRQTYTQAQVGADFLNSYGWCEIEGPEGEAHRNDLRITIGLWGRGLCYPTHAHAPEEVYTVLAGDALFRSGTSTRRLGPGDSVHHAPWQSHSIEMTPGPLVALAVWRGEGLSNPSDLTPDDH